MQRDLEMIRFCLRSLLIFNMAFVSFFREGNIQLARLLGGEGR